MPFPVTLREQIGEQLTAAMRSGDVLRRDTLRMATNAAYNAEKRQQRPLIEEATAEYKKIVDLQPVPPRHHHGLFAMHYRVPEFAIQGDTLAFMQHAHIARRVLEIGKWLVLGNAPPVPVSPASRPSTAPAGRLTHGDGGLVARSASAFGCHSSLAAAAHSRIPTSGL